MLEANQVDGIISGSHNLGIEDYNRVTAPIIAFDRNLSPEIPVVSSDNYAGGVLAAGNPAKTGAQKIIMITGNDNPLPQLDSGMLVLLQSCQKHKSLMFLAIIHLFGKEMEIKSILTQQKPDAIFASDDLTAILVMKIADELGIAIPEDLKSLATTGPTLSKIISPSHHHQATLTRDCSSDGRPSPSKIEGKDVKTTGYFLPVNVLPGKSV